MLLKRTITLNVRTGTHYIRIRCHILYSVTSTQCRILYAVLLLLQIRCLENIVDSYVCETLFTEFGTQYYQDIYADNAPTMVVMSMVE